MKISTLEGSMMALVFCYLFPGSSRLSFYGFTFFKPLLQNNCLFLINEITYTS
ncbi:uncharacterized protein B0P05DRAFT_637976, partial [Gilbertella persicaria]|uniref:uncharacterized protein n=1 Tax=Gilbertella persicaria TaxID=101096 RepID=UPI00221F85E8